MANRVRKCVYLYVFGHSRQLSLNKFFDSSNTFMKEVDDGGEKHGKKWEGGTGCGRRKKIMTDMVVTNFAASLPPEHQPLVPKIKVCSAIGFNLTLDLRNH